MRRWPYRSTGGQRRSRRSCSRRAPMSVRPTKRSCCGVRGTLRTYGYAVEYCTSIDLHTTPAFLRKYQLLLSVGHDEYWSKEMRDNVETFIGHGGNVAFFSGNTCYWQVRFEDNNQTMVCYKEASKGKDPLFDVEPDRATVQWSQPPVNRPENTLTGVGTLHGANCPPGSDAMRYKAY